MSEIWFGTMPFGGQVGEKTARAMVERCLDAGITRFDTADAYNRGASEEILGRALKGVDGAIVATKVGAKFGKAPPESGLSRGWILSSIDGSLRRLGREAVDVYYLHQPDHGVPIDETLDAFGEVLRSGRARSMGISNYAAWQVMEMISKGRKPAVGQQMLNLIARGLEQEYLPFAGRYGIPTLAYNPLAGGLLTGKHDRSRPPAKGTRFDDNEMYQKRFWQARMFDAVDRLAAIAREAGRTLTQLSLQWVLQKAEGVVLGATRMDQLEENLAALDGKLDDGTLDACDGIWEDLRGPVPKYNR